MEIEIISPQQPQRALEKLEIVDVINIFKYQQANSPVNSNWPLAKPLPRIVIVQS